MLAPVSGSADARDRFAAALAAFDPARPALLVGHFDADGLCATAILARAFARAGRAARTRIAGKGENPWDDGWREAMAAMNPGGLVVSDLGVRAEPLLPGVPTVLIDHHIPQGAPDDATLIGGNGLDPEPSSALLAWWAAHALGDVDDLQWLAAMGMIGDMADGGGWPELEAARARWGKTALSDAVRLVNAPRRTAAADPSPAFRLLMTADGPKAIVKGDGPDQQALRAAKAEVAAELAEAKRAAPSIRGDVALIRFASPAQVHPLVAQAWRGRLPDKVVIAANAGYRPGWVHFAARTATGTNLVGWFGARRPPGAGAHYGSGHAAASGGALTADQWRAFLATIGFEDPA